MILKVEFFSRFQRQCRRRVIKAVGECDFNNTLFVKKSIRGLKMKKNNITSTGIMASLIFASMLLPATASHASTKSAAAAPNKFCTVPTTKSGTAVQTAWQIFTAVNCKNNGKFAWENWTEQTCLKAPSTPGCTATSATGGKKKRFLHASHLSLKSLGLSPTKSPIGVCSPMTTAASFSGPNPADPSLKPFLPKNLAATAQFCEEVFVNDAEANFIKSPPGAAAGVNLQTLAGQAAYIKAKGTLAFPTAAVELKIDWLPSDALTGTSTFNCTNKKPLGVYVEVIEGKCYALVGMHVSSKLYPNWLWATFEPQNSITNPNRCNPKLYSNCVDPWGSNPAVSTGNATAATKNLSNLMDQAGLPPEFRNYRLVGIQTVYDDPKGTKMLGSSFVEYNAGVPAQQASCITCHSYAMMNTASNPPSENPNFGPFPGTPPIGTPGAPPPGNWLKQDFSWLLGIMPPK
jgi:hypothetical protein